MERTLGILEQGRISHPGDVKLDVEYAEIAMAQRDWATATER